MKRLGVVLFVLAFPLAACTFHRPSLPLTDKEPPVTLSSTAFAGYARAFRFADGSWMPVPEFNYEFIVLERRFAGRWEAVKEIHYRHPRYDGRAGPRDQTIYFAVRTSPAADRGLDLAVEGTLGSKANEVVSRNFLDEHEFRRLLEERISSEPKLGPLDYERAMREYYRRASYAYTVPNLDQQIHLAEVDDGVPAPLRGLRDLQIRQARERSHDHGWAGNEGNQARPCRREPAQAHGFARREAEGRHRLCFDELGGDDSLQPFNLNLNFKRRSRLWPLTG